MLLDYNEVTVSCSQYGVQSGQDSERDARLGILAWAQKSWRVEELLGLPQGIRVLWQTSATEDTVQNQGAEKAVAVLAHTDAMIERHRKLKL